jgi:hypothetical protein
MKPRRYRTATHRRVVARQIAAQRKQTTRRSDPLTHAWLPAPREAGGRNSVLFTKKKAGLPMDQ